MSLLQCRLKQDTEVSSDTMYSGVKTSIADTTQSKKIKQRRNNEVDKNVVVKKAVQFMC